MIASLRSKFNLKNKIILSLAGFILAILTLIYFVVVPTARDIKIMGREIEEQKIDLERKYLKGQSLKQLTENLKKIEPELSRLDQIFINENRGLEFITTLENEAGKSGVSQKINLSSPEAAENKEFQKNKLQLFAGGNFIRQLGYLLSLESLAYYINVKMIEITPSPAGSEPETNESDGVNMFIDADTYWK